MRACEFVRRTEEERIKKKFKEAKNKIRKATVNKPL